MERNDILDATAVEAYWGSARNYDRAGTTVWKASTNSKTDLAGSIASGSSLCYSSDFSDNLAIVYQYISANL